MVCSVLIILFSLYYLCYLLSMSLLILSYVSLLILSSVSALHLFHLSVLILLYISVYLLMLFFLSYVFISSVVRFLVILSCVIT